jgi:hypothetical protein
MATLAETRHKAGRILRIVRYGQALNADDDALLTEAYAQVYAQLKTEGIAVWASTGGVPDSVMPHVAALMAFSVTADKGVPADVYARTLALRNVATPEIRRLTKPMHESLDEPTDY